MYRSIFKLTKNINYFVTNPIYRYNQISKQTLAATCHDALFQSKRTFSSDSMEKEFQTAVANLQKVSTDVDNDKKLKLYALYKQATNGPCSDEKPSMFNVVDKAKWQAWKALGDQSSDDAKKDYISIVNELLAASGASEESSKQEPDIVFESKNHVYTIRLNRPKQYNAITPEIYEGIIDALKRAGEDPDIKFVVITGTGKYFSSGNDLSMFPSIDNKHFFNMTIFQKILQRVCRLLEVIWRKLHQWHGILCLDLFLHLLIFPNH